MFGKGWDGDGGRGWGCIACVALGALGAYVIMKNKDKLKPMAASLVAKGIQLKEKALNAAATAKEHAEDIVAEAKHINETTE